MALSLGGDHKLSRHALAPGRYGGRIGPIRWLVELWSSRTSLGSSSTTSFVSALSTIGRIRSCLICTIDMFILWLPPEKLDKPFLISFAGFTMTVFGILIWSVHHAGGTAGPYFAHDYKTDSPVLADSIRKSLDISPEGDDSELLCSMGCHLRRHSSTWQHGHCDSGSSKLVSFGQDRQQEINDGASHCFDHHGLHRL